MNLLVGVVDALAGLDVDKGHAAALVVGKVNEASAAAQALLPGQDPTLAKHAVDRQVAGISYAACAGLVKEMLALSLPLKLRRLYNSGLQAVIPVRANARIGSGDERVPAKTTVSEEEDLLQLSSVNLTCEGFAL